jgi:hypothetical protein
MKMNEIHFSEKVEHYIYIYVGDPSLTYFNLRPMDAHSPRYYNTKMEK